MGAYVNAVNLKAAGRCERAERTLEVFARQGVGFEVAQFHLGDCLTRRALNADGAERELLMRRGLHWLELAAYSKEAKAQEQIPGGS